MRDLTRWQLISFISRGVAMAFGIVQSFVIVRILSVGEWGVVQIAVSIGGAFGIYQHLGLASGSTREISAAKNDTEVFKIFITAALIRYLITIPIAIFLFFSAETLAVNKYFEPMLILPIKIYAFVLLIQGIQSILNSVISGTKRFKRLFLYQSCIAVVSVFLFIPLVYYYRVYGYFYALALFNVISSLILTYLAFKPLRCEFSLPSKADFKILFKDLLSISLAVYIVKVIYTMWEKSGPLILGLYVSKEMVGIFAFALLYAKKLMAISDAVTDVNLPVMSEKYLKNIEEFKELFSRNFDKLFVFILFSAFTVIYWAPEVIKFVVGGDKYNPSFPYILPVVFAFVFYSFINIIKSSVFIPAKFIKDMILSFIFLLGGTILTYIISLKMLGFLFAMSYGMLIGSFISLVILVISTKFRLKFFIMKTSHFLLLIQAAAISLFIFVPSLYFKISFYPIFILMFLWGVFMSKFITYADIDRSYNYLKVKIKNVK